MTDDSFRRFIAEIIDIRPGMAGLGSASSAIIGTTGIEGVTAEKLHRDAIAFANEFSRPAPDRGQLLELAGDLEGSLLAVKMVSGISDAKLDTLRSTLHGFVSPDS